MKLSGFGRYLPCEAELIAPRDEDGIRQAMDRGALIARGNGRAYGDAAVAPRSLDMRHFNRMLAFDESTGQLVVEAGVLLDDIIATFLNRGWFPYVTPGTKFVTVGGMIAADVHGKNHHKDGSFRQFVDWLDLLTEDGTIKRCSRTEAPELFDWTIGGMGLTGIVLRAAFRLREVETAWIRQVAFAAPDLSSAFEIFERSANESYSVAWIDSLASGGALGRSIVMLGNHAQLAELPMARRHAPLALQNRKRPAVPFDAPGWLLNGHFVRLFNAAYYRRGQAAEGRRLVDLDSFFYPLDALPGWNRIYGRRGFLQFQCVLPLAASLAGMIKLLEAISAAGIGSFLAVLKRFGHQDGQFSFPMEGYTLALDFPATAKALALLDRLDAIVIEHGGRFYLAKDARMSAQTLHRSDPRATRLAGMRQTSGLAACFASRQSLRLEL